MAKGEHLRGIGGGSFKWAKGQSGNPQGKPKGSKDSRIVLGEFFDTILKGEHPITGEQGEFSVRELLFSKQIAKALNDGDTTAFNSLMDRYEGKAKQTSSISINAAHNLRYENLETLDDFKKALQDIDDEEKELEKEYGKVLINETEFEEHDTNN